MHSATGAQKFCQTSCTGSPIAVSSTQPHPASPSQHPAPASTQHPAPASPSQHPASTQPAPNQHPTTASAADSRGRHGGRSVPHHGRGEWRPGCLRLLPAPTWHVPHPHDGLFYHPIKGQDWTTQQRGTDPATVHNQRVTLPTTDPHCLAPILAWLHF